MESVKVSTALLFGAVAFYIGVELGTRTRERQFSQRELKYANKEETIVRDFQGNEYNLVLRTPTSQPTTRATTQPTQPSNLENLQVESDVKTGR